MLKQVQHDDTFWTVPNPCDTFKKLLHFTKMFSMTKDDFFFLVETETIHDFLYKGKAYTITYDKSPDGRKLIIFGDIADKQKYDSVGEFLNKAKIENHFFKDMLDIF